MIVGLTGYAQHGKDTAARILVEDYGFWRIGFADALKRLAYEVDPFVAVTTTDLDAVRLRWLVDNVGWEGAKQNPEVRRFLQELGTKMRDIIGPDVWVQALDRAVVESGQNNIVISDVRFPNEAEYVKRHSGEVWRVHRPDFDNGIGTDHVSEKHVADLPASALLVNATSLVEFEAMVRDVAGTRLGVMPTWASNA